MSVRWSCFAYNSQVKACSALKDTYCRDGKQCAFYKSKLAYEEECKKIEEQLGIGKVRDGK